MIDGLEVHKFIPGQVHASSAHLPWTSLLVRHYVHPLETEPTLMPACTDQVVVLIVRGSTLLESQKGKKWLSARHIPGNVGMNAPHERAINGQARRQ